MAQTPVPGTRVRLRLVKVEAADAVKPIWLNLDSIKSFATVEAAPGVEIPEGAEVAQTLVTLKGEARALKIDGTPKQLLERLQNGVIEF